MMRFFLNGKILPETRVLEGEGVVRRRGLSFAKDTTGEGFRKKGGRAAGTWAGGPRNSSELAIEGAKTLFSEGGWCFFPFFV
jgi:hypothetical protein